MIKLVNIGFGNLISANKITAVVSPDSAPIRRSVQEAKDSPNMIDATCGRRTRSVIFTDNGQIVLSALQPETILGRVRGGENSEDER